MAEGSPQEREIKLGFDLGRPLPSFEAMNGGTVQPRDVITLDATYFDTAELALAAAHLGARRRTGVAWTFKGPSVLREGAVVREEREWPDSEAMPAELYAAVRAVVGDVTLEPVARLRTRRSRLDVLEAGGTPLAEIDDDDVEILDGDRVVERFREVEIELHEGTAESHPVVGAVVAALREAGATPGGRGKYSRALAALGRRPAN